MLTYFTCIYVLFPLYFYFLSLPVFVYLYLCRSVCLFLSLLLALSFSSLCYMVLSLCRSACLSVCLVSVNRWPSATPVVSGCAKRVAIYLFCNNLTNMLFIHVYTPTKITYFANCHGPQKA